MGAILVMLLGLLSPSSPSPAPQAMDPAVARDPLTAWRYARRIGKPLLIIVVPDAPKRQRRWEEAVSVMLNSGDARLVAALERHHVIAADRILLRRIGIEPRGLAIQIQTQTRPSADAPAVWQIFTFPLPDLVAASRPADPVLARTWHEQIEPIEQAPALAAVDPLRHALTAFLEQAPPTAPTTERIVLEGFVGGVWVDTPGGCQCTTDDDGVTSCGMAAARPPVLQRTLRLRNVWQR